MLDIKCQDISASAALINLSPNFMEAQQQIIAHTSHFLIIIFFNLLIYPLVKVTRKKVIWYYKNRDTVELIAGVTLRAF